MSDSNRQAGRSEQPMRIDVLEQREAAGHLELLIDTVKVHLDGPFADGQLLSDLPVLQATADPADELALTRGEDLGQLAHPRFTLEQFLQGLADGAAFDPVFAGMDLANAWDQELVRHLFEDNPAYTEAASLQRVIGIQRGRQEHDPHRDSLLGDVLEYPPLRLSRQAEIEDEDIWAMLVHRPQGLLAIAAARHHVEVGFLLQQVLQPSQDEGVRISKHKTNGHCQLLAA
jgi:hypothetical protein